MTDQELLKVFKYLDAMEGRMNDRFDQIDKRFDRVYVILDDHTKRLDRIEIEMVATGSKVDRNERKIHFVADKTNVQIPESI